jgi:two-component system KDP operon response regulator KdpE
MEGVPLALRIVLIEHQAVHVAEMRELLSGAGHDVTATASSDAGIRAARDKRPDIVLCALDEPSSGLEALVTLRTDVAFDSTPIVAVTFHSAPEDIRHLRSVGFDGVIAKPVSKTAFVGQVEGFLHRGNKNN